MQGRRALRAEIILSGEPTETILKRNAEIKKKIEALKAEKCPNHIKTPLGIKSWNYDHQKRILELEKQLT